MEAETLIDMHVQVHNKPVCADSKLKRWML